MCLNDRTLTWVERLRHAPLAVQSYRAPAPRRRADRGWPGQPLSPVAVRRDRRHRLYLCPCPCPCLCTHPHRSTDLLAGPSASSSSLSLAFAISSPPTRCSSRWPGSSSTSAPIHTSTATMRVTSASSYWPLAAALAPVAIWAFSGRRPSPAPSTSSTICRRPGAHHGSRVARHRGAARGAGRHTAARRRAADLWRRRCAGVSATRGAVSACGAPHGARLCYHRWAR
jgi:hypothetical protein